MEIFNRLAVAAAYICSLFYEEDPSYIDITTRGSFPVNTAFTLAPGLGWAKGLANFSAFHATPHWYGKETALALNQGMQHNAKKLYWVFEPELYHFAGGKTDLPDVGLPAS